jgi:hypothetical protein
MTIIDIYFVLYVFRCNTKQNRYRWCNDDHRYLFCFVRMSFDAIAEYFCKL